MWTVRHDFDVLKVVQLNGSMMFYSIVTTNLPIRVTEFWSSIPLAFFFSLQAISRSLAVDST